jgi:hypothetical protein
MLKLIAIDVDGTLLDNEHQLSDENKNWIRFAVSQGATLALASGRPLHGLFDVYDQLDLHLGNHYLVGFNGAQIADAKTHELIYEQTHPIELSKTILRHLEQFDISVILSKGSELYVQDPNAYMLDVESSTNKMDVVVVNKLADFIDYRPNKILISGEPTKLKALRNQIEEPFRDIVDFVPSSPHFLEIIVKDCNKGTSIAKLQENLKLDRSEVMAIGDNYNDLTMIEYAGVGVAMGNAYPDIQAKADFVTLTNDENGVAHALKHHFKPDIKCIAVDMDGTFLNREGDFDRANLFELYEAMKAQGIRFVVASGNQYYQLRSFFEDIADEISFVAENGALVFDQGQKLFSTQFPEAGIQRVYDYLEKHPSLKSVVCTEHMAYVLEDEAFKKIISRYCHKLDTIDDFRNIPDTPIKININFPDHETSERVQGLNAILGEDLVAVSSGHGTLDIIVKGYNKAHGLKLLAERYGFSHDQILAFGDGGNDIEMLAYATHSYAMHNATQDVKAVAKYSAPSNDEDGVHQILEYYL